MLSRDKTYRTLNEFCFKSLAAAIEEAHASRQPFVRVQDWLRSMLQTGTGLDPDCLLKSTGLDVDSVLARLPISDASLSGERPLIDATLDRLIERSWLFASIELGARTLRSAHLLLTLSKDAELSSVRDELKLELLTRLADEPAEAVLSACQLSQESMNSGSVQDSGGLPNAEATEPPSWLQDLTARAAEDPSDPVIGRDAEIAGMTEILVSRRQNNPLLLGDAGTGKTAIVEGLAQRIVTGQVPQALQSARVMALDLAALQAGASMKGEFEQRLRSVIEWVEQQPQMCVLFIDELHTLVGAGGREGTGDAANLLKPALARGLLRTIGATTWGEFKKHIDADKAFASRFRLVSVEEPDREEALAIMVGVRSQLESHHDLRIEQAALEASVDLSSRYLPERRLPRVAVSVLDNACARVRLSNDSEPLSLKRLRSRLEHLERVAQSSGRDVALDPEQAKSDAERLDGLREQLKDAKSRFVTEKSLSDAAMQALESGDEKQLTEALDALTAFQGDAPTVFPWVSERAVASVVADASGIPLGNLGRDETDRLLELEGHLHARVVGQDSAVALLAERIRTGRAGLSDPVKPKGVFLLLGPSGVGKTETAESLAELLYGGRDNLITINMSEMQAEHSVAKLIGAPAGYVGFGEGGMLTEAVRRQPYSVVLLDEFEKAHESVHELFFQVFDKGVLEDAAGERAYFHNAVILLTSNVGTEYLLQIERPGDDEPDQMQQWNAELRAQVLEVFPDALVGRTTLVPYFPLQGETLGVIARLKLAKVGERLAQQGIRFEVSDAAIELLVARCWDVRSGARALDNLISAWVLPPIARLLLERMEQTPLSAVLLDASADDFVIDAE